MLRRLRIENLVLIREAELELAPRHLLDDALCVGHRERDAHPRVALVTIRPGGYAGGRTPMDLLISQEVIKAVESVRGPAIKIPSSGGSIPLTMIDNALGTRTIVMPIANHDDNQHAFDENLRLQNLWDGIELMAALLTM